MQPIKRAIKKILPTAIKDDILNAYHLAEAVAANVQHGFPARSGQVIMVTGTNGKTTTAMFIVKMLEAAGYKVGANTTALYQAGSDVRLNDRNMTVDNVFKLQKLLSEMKKANCDFYVVEVTSHALMQHRVWGVPCDVAVMTNLSQDHLDYHKTMQRYAAAKGKMFAKRPRFIVLNRDDEWFDFFNKFEAGEKKVSYGTSEQATCRITDVKMRHTESVVKITTDGTSISFTAHLPGKFNVYNAAAAAAVGHVLQLEPATIVAGLSALHEVPGRLEPINEGQKFSVFVDYAHTPAALENVLGALRQLTNGKLWVVFGATGNRDRGKRPIMGEVVAKLADKIVLTDDEPYDEQPDDIRRAVYEGIEKAGAAERTLQIADRGEAIAAAIDQAKAGDTVLITGMGHEQFRVVAGKRLPWSDAAVARTALKKRA